MKPVTKQVQPADEVPYAETADAVEAATKGMEANVEVLKQAGIPQIRGYLADALDKAGATIEASAKVLADAHVAQKVTYFQREGSVTDQRAEIDHRTRLQAAELNLKARGEMKDQEATAIFMNISDEVLAGIANGTVNPAGLIDLGPRINEVRETKAAEENK